MNELKRFDIVGKYRDEETMYEFRPDGECYDADEVDKAIEELKARIRELESMPHTDNSAVIAQLEDDVAFWKSKYHNCKRELDLLKDTNDFYNGGIQMSELKSYTIYEGDVGNYTEHVVYSKSEADAYIRKLKYKRCLAMAEWCEATALWSFQAANTLPEGIHATLYGKPVMIEPGRLFKRYVLLTKWHKRWLELAEKFKEAK